ncbi:hypothetical protein V502_08148 [Pseudogymnoascus sp. VKM F-4520 (FW-2644)]|nr:hypothetical protein V502_08148 [Pseudogymnoascus sp. VKM F-4520 (FW-2644)]
MPSPVAQLYRSYGVAGAMELHSLRVLEDTGALWSKYYYAKCAKTCTAALDAPGTPEQFRNTAGRGRDLATASRFREAPVLFVKALSTLDSTPQ